MFVFVLIFQSFASRASQPRILKWGILGAVLMRLVFIVAGVSLWPASLVMYVFGGLLIVTAIQMVTEDEKKR